MPNPLFAQMPTTIFEEMSSLARAHGAINLGQGFPDEDGPRGIRERAAYASLELSNQYPSSRGMPELRQAIAAFYADQELDLDWELEVTVTSGATEALAAAFLALLQPGDEVVLFQPLYDSYAPMMRLMGAVPRLVSLTPDRWGFTREMLEAVFSDRTKLCVVNSPNNPTGVVLSSNQLSLIAEFCVRHDVIAVCDEVWEATCLPGATHHAMMALPGMRERTVKIGSAGKLFALTGWKVGWLIAAPELTHALARSHQFLTFTTAPNLQHAVAWGLANSDAWFKDMPQWLWTQQERLKHRLREAGFVSLDVQGTYFICVDLAASGVRETDRAFCLRAVKEHGVAAIPLSSFYEQDPVTSIIRLCFAKNNDTLDEGARRLEAARAAAV